jgi:hypothetical protein
MVIERQKKLGQWQLRHCLTRGIKPICLTPPAGLPDERLLTYSNITSIALPKLAGRNLDLELRRKKPGWSPVPHLGDRDNISKTLLCIPNTLLCIQIPIIVFVCWACSPDIAITKATYKKLSYKSAITRQCQIAPNYFGTPSILPPLFTPNPVSSCNLMLVEVGLQAPILLAYVRWSFCSHGDVAEAMWIVR